MSFLLWIHVHSMSIYCLFLQVKDLPQILNILITRIVKYALRELSIKIII